MHKKIFYLLLTCVNFFHLVAIGAGMTITINNENCLELITTINTHKPRSINVLFDDHCTQRAATLADLFDHLEQETKNGITKIDLSDNDLEEVPDFNAFNHLAELYLDNNWLERAPGLPASIEHLSLANNELETPPAIHHLINLMSIDIRDNRLRVPLHIPYLLASDPLFVHHEAHLTSLEALETSIKKNKSIEHFFRQQPRQIKELFQITLIDQLSNFVGNGFEITESELIVKIQEALDEERAEALRKTQIPSPENRQLKEVVIRVGENVSQDKIIPHFYTHQSIEHIKQLEDKFRKNLENELTCALLTNIAADIARVHRGEEQEVDDEQQELNDKRIGTICERLQDGVLHAESLTLITTGANTVTLDLKTQPRTLVDAWRFWKEKGMSLADFLRVSKDANVDRSTQLVDPLTLHSFTLERATAEAFFKELGIEPTAVETLASSASSNFIELEEVIKFLTIKKSDLLFPRSRGEIYVNITKKLVAKKRSHDVLDGYSIFNNRKRRLRDGLN
ncbi:hypothetical protein KJZ61_00665 [Candidatus Dependentiae bacterium]|nr:hypothetical protein [Candidatus Dependentiae bacterium]